MRIAVSCLAMVFFAAIPIQAGELIINGDIEQPFSTGWTQVTSGSAYTFNRGTAYDGDPDFEAYVQKATGSGYARLCQEVSIPTTDLGFSANAKLAATASDGNRVGIASRVTCPLIAS